MTKQAKQRVIDFLSHLRGARLVSFKMQEEENVYTPAQNVHMLYQDHEVLEIQEYVKHNVFDSAIVIARYGEEECRFETITPATLKHFQAFVKVALPR